MPPPEEETAERGKGTKGGSAQEVGKGGARKRAGKDAGNPSCAPRAAHQSKRKLTSHP